MSEEKVTKIVDNASESNMNCVLAPEEIIEKAIQKLKEEKKTAKNKSFATPITEYLIRRCEEDAGMAEDILQKHKTWEKCFQYITSQAKKQAVGNCAAISDEVVYEWAEDYYRKDDKALEEKKDKEEKKRKERAEEVKKEAEKKKEAAPKVEKKEKKATPKEEPKKKANELEGQMDLFSMMGM